MSVEPPAPPPERPPLSAGKTSTPAAHWRRRPRAVPIPAGHAVRQGDISRLAFLSLGRDEAIAFLNTENARLGGRPIAIATQSDAGEASVRAELRRLDNGRTNVED